MICFVAFFGCAFIGCFLSNLTEKYSILKFQTSSHIHIIQALILRRSTLTLATQKDRSLENKKKRPNKNEKENFTNHDK